MRILSSCIAVFCLLATTAIQAQVTTPQPSPLGKVEQSVGLTTVNIEYSRPSAKGRKVFGDVVPFGEIWRTGANASTKVTFSDDVTIQGSKLPKGTYALYTIPDTKAWTVIFHKNLIYWGSGGKEYNQSEDALRVMIEPQKLPQMTETFTIGINNITNTSADLCIQWENTQINIPFSVDVDSKVEAAIKKTMAGPAAGDYYSAGRYYYESGKDKKQALDWINLSLEKGGDKFWILKLKSEIQASMGDVKGAIATAQKSMELAKTENNMDYVRMNEKNIKTWTAGK